MARVSCGHFAKVRQIEAINRAFRESVKDGVPPHRKSIQSCVYPRGPLWPTPGIPAPKRHRTLPKSIIAKRKEYPKRDEHHKRDKTEHQPRAENNQQSKHSERDHPRRWTPIGKFRYSTFTRFCFVGL